MLKRIYADNFRCMVNFEIRFENKITLLLGPNGGGKSTLFDLLFKIWQLIYDNARIGDLFPQEDLTSWVNKNIQTFELDVEGEGGLFAYKLIIQHDEANKKPKIESESLRFDGKPIFEFNQGEVKVYNDANTKVSETSFNSTISAMAFMKPDSKKLNWFKNWISCLFVMSLEPKAMVSEAEEESSWLDRGAKNFASWYRSISQEHQDKILQLFDQLRKIIPGFNSFKLEPAGKIRILKAKLDSEDKKDMPIFLDFKQLSDGQRVIIVLYSLLLCLQDQGFTLLIDEPENYVTLPEIQPWLMMLQDTCGKGFPQAVLISHHPELVDYFGSECGIWIDRAALGPSRASKIKDLSSQKDSILKLSELIARGWLE